MKKKITFKGALITGAVVVFLITLFGVVFGLITSVFRNFWNFIWPHLAIPLPTTLTLKNWTWLNLKFLSYGWQSYISCWIASLIVAIIIGYALSLMKEEGGVSSRIPLINWVLLIKRSLRTFTEKAKIVLGVHPATGQISRGFSPQDFTYYSPDKREKIDFSEFCLALAPNPTSGFQSLATEEEVAHIDYPGKEYLSKTISFSIVGQDWAVAKNWDEFNKIKMIIEQRRAWRTLPKDIQELKEEISQLKEIIESKNADQ